MKAEEVVKILNTLWAINPNAIQQLVDYRVPCNQNLVDSPHVITLDEPSGPVVGMLGIINGLIGIRFEGQGPIAAVYDDAGEFTGFVLTSQERRKHG